MITEIIEAISVALNSEFGDEYEIHMEEIRQGLVEPCFFYYLSEPRNKAACREQISVHEPVLHQLFSQVGGKATGM